MNNALKIIEQLQLLSQLKLANETFTKETALQEIQELFPLKRLSKVYELETQLADKTFRNLVVSIIQPLQLDCMVLFGFGLIHLTSVSAQ